MHQQPIRVNDPDLNFLAGGPHNRLLLSLQSGLPNEVDWAFNKLVKLSYTCPPQVRIEKVLGLLDCIIAHSEPFFEQLKLNTALDNFETTLETESWTQKKPGKHLLLPVFNEFTVFNNKESAELMERVMQVMHILRNFSFLDDTARFFITQHSILTILAKALALPPFSNYIEIKIHALEIFENLAPYLQLRGKNDFYLACLRKMVFEQDRALVLGSLRSLRSLFLQEINHTCLMSLESDFYARMFQLLLVKDEEIVYNVLEIMLIQTGLGPEASAKLIAAAPTNIVRMLSSVLHLREKIPTAEARQPLAQQNPNAQRPNAIQSIIPNAMGQDWIGGWLRSFYEPSPDQQVYMKDIKRQLDEWCTVTSRPLITLDAFCVEIRRCWPGKVTVDVALPVLRGVRKVPMAAPRHMQSGLQPGSMPSSNNDEMEDDLDGMEEVLAEGDANQTGNMNDFSVDSMVSVADDTSDTRCRWTNLGDRLSVPDECKQQFVSDKDLFQHVALSHLPPNGSRFQCRWKNCTALDAYPLPRDKALSHFQIHLGPPAKSTFGTPPAPPKVLTVSDDSDDLKGVPLTSLLVMRNLARNPRNRELFTAYEIDLANAMTNNPKISKFVADVLYELS
ncbi:Chromatin structure-remodeling complex protein rsc9 [Irineochytrium annulatum]|nr:Chromatin structure-remodeling complex protein rsc9 [Irineochytrium annulatum]